MASVVIWHYENKIKLKIELNRSLLSCTFLVILRIHTFKALIAIKWLLLRFDMKQKTILYLVPQPHGAHLEVFQAVERCMQTDLKSVVERFLEDTSSSNSQRTPPETPDIYSINMSAQKTDTKRGSNNRFRTSSEINTTQPQDAILHI